MSKTQIATGGIADDAVSEEHLDATAITGHTALAAAPAGTDEFLISDDGVLKRLDASYVGETNTPIFKVNRSSNQSISHNTRTKIQWNNEVFDADNVFDSSTNHRFTVPSGKAGKYFFYLQIMVGSFSGSTSSHKFVNAEIDVNGSISAKGSEPFHITGGNDFYSRLSTTLDLSVSDYVETYIYQDNNDSSAKNVYGASNNYFSYFTGFRISSWVH